MRGRRWTGVAAAAVVILGTFPVLADYTQARRAFDRGDYATALSEARAASKTGDPRADHLLGAMCMRGAGMKRDPKKAADFFEKAASKNYAPAQYNLGVAYALGAGRPQDYRKAADWYRRAAEQGHNRARYDLGWLYLKGLGVGKDEVQAARWIAMAAQGGMVAAEVEYAIMAFRGRGVERNIPVAVAWFKRAAAKGNAVARNRLAHLYRLGIGVPLDPVKSATWHLLARRAGIRDRVLDGFSARLSMADRLKASEAASRIAGKDNGRKPL